MEGRTVLGVKATDGTGQQGYTAPKHVWVRSLEPSAHPAPGVLLDWRVAGEGRWEAYVVWADGSGVAGARLEWVDQDRVTPPA